MHILGVEDSEGVGEKTANDLMVIRKMPSPTE